MPSQPRPATEADATAIHDLRRTLAAWLIDRGIRQWHPDDVPLQAIRSQIEAGEWFVVTAGSEAVIATVRYLLQDDEVWPDDSAGSAYVHGLMVDRSHAGQHIGDDLLRWAERRTADHGLSRLRLDCVETNRPLRNYYVAQGFREVGRRAFDDPQWHPVALFEKPVAQPAR